MNELELVAGCKNKKRDCQRFLYEKYAGLMYGLCLRYCSDADAAQDLLHDGFIKVFSVIDSYSGKGSFEGWLKRVFVNLALENLRKEKRIQLHESLEDIGDLPDSLPNEDAMSMISEDQLIEMIQSLPKGYRTVFNLYAVENYSHKEIAQMNNISEGTSRSQYVRARQLLQDKVVEFLKNNS